MRNMSKSLKFWNRIASSYDLSVKKRYKATYKEMIAQSKKYLSENNLLLDVGCGTGISTSELAPFVNRIEAFDISEKMIEIASNKAKSANILNIDFQVCDIMNEKYKPGVYDVITAFNVLLFYNSNENPLDRIFQLLKPGGIFLSTTDCYAENGIMINIAVKLLSKIGVMPFIKLYSCKSLEKEIENSGFTIIDKKVLFNKPVNFFMSAKK